MTLTAQIKNAAEIALKTVYPDVDFPENIIAVNQTKPEFPGDYTVVLFPLVKQLKQKPDEIGNALGKQLMENTELFAGYDIVSGFFKSYHSR